MDNRRRLVAAGLVVLIAAGVGIFVLRDDADTPTYRDQVCGLPEKTLELARRSLSIERSGDIALLANPPLVLLNEAGETTAGDQPSLQSVPLVFRGPSVIPARRVDAEASHADIAPTIATLLRGSFQSGGGRSLKDVAAFTSTDLTRPLPRLVVTVVWGGIGTEALEANPSDWPNLERLMDEGVAFRSATVGHLYPARATVAATIGTGSFPANHGITGSLVRDEAGEVVEAFGGDGVAAAPLLQTTLGERWLSSFASGVKPMTGVLGYSPQDNAYLPAGGRNFGAGGVKPASFSHTQKDNVRVLVERAGYGRDAVTDLLTIVYPAVAASADETPAAALAGNVRLDDHQLGRLTRLLDDRLGPRRWVLVLTGDRGKSVESEIGIREADLSASIEEEFGSIVEGVADGQVFLDRAALASADLTVDDVAAWLIERSAEDLNVSEEGVDASLPAFRLAVPTASLLEMDCSKS